MGVVVKRFSMVFYSDGRCPYSHRVRIALAEKGVSVEVIDVDVNNKPEDIAQLNPYNELPTLVDRELVLYESDVMMEYLDERFPHPPLLPVYPVLRAQNRLLMYRIERDWGQYVRNLLSSTDEKVLDFSRKELRDGLVSISQIFSEKDYFMSDEFTLVDCTVASILWRLPVMGIELPVRQCKDLLAYADRLFERDSFQASLSIYESDMR